MDTARIQRLLSGDDVDPRAALDELFPADEGRSSHEIAVAWAAERLRSSGVDPAASPMAAIKTLRDADPRLDLAPARYLIRRVTRL
ncbi:hypothetical protein P0L94_14665 [Microbacter sp. GSS18]|nr:hypothetical protein P0L94_14665 [Microbacter sp. GSS18]